MSHQVLARQYRPRRFEEVVGQAHVVTALQNALTAGRLHHAYLFTGTRGVGKTTLARILAKSLNCLGADGQGGLTAHPCGVCSACREIDQGRFVDLLEVDAATNTGVDAMRDLLDTAQYVPVAGRYKVYIIDEVHMLSKNAFNSMLKTLEEPPAHLKFILATTDPQRVPVTVLSRCLQFNLKNLAPPVIARHLADVLQREGITFDTAALDLLGQAAQGSARDALSLLDQAIAFGAGSVQRDLVAQMLGASSIDVLYPLADALLASDGRLLVAAIDALADRNLAFDALLTDWASLMHRIAVVQALAGQGSEIGESPEVLKLAAALPAEDVQAFYQIGLLARRDLPLAPEARTGFAMAMLRMLSFRPVKDTEGAKADGRAVRPAPTMGGGSGVLAMPVTNLTTTVTVTPQAARPAQPHQPPQPAQTLTSEGHAADLPDFDGDWPTLVARAQLSGMSLLVARNSVLMSHRGGHFTLAVPPDVRQYASPLYEDALAKELRRVLGVPARVSLQVAQPEQPTAAQTDHATHTRDLAAARAALLSDPFVRALMDDMGAKLDEASIRPPARGNASLH
jgi:DNA polymerase III subunit gamma/tau